MGSTEKKFKRTSLVTNIILVTEGGRRDTGHCHGRRDGGTSGCVWTLGGLE